MFSKRTFYLFVIILTSILFQNCEQDEYAHWFDNSKEFTLKESNIKVKLPEDFELTPVDSIYMDSTYKDYVKKAIEVFNPNDGIIETYLDNGSSFRIVCFIQDTTFYKALQQHDGRYGPFDTMKIYFDALKQYSDFELTEFRKISTHLEYNSFWEYCFDVEFYLGGFYPERFFQSNFMFPRKKELITVIEFSDDNNHQEQRLAKYLISIGIYNREVSEENSDR